MMKNCLFLGAALPPLEWGETPQISFDALVELYRMNLSLSDFKKVELIRRLIDLNNVRQLLKKEPLDPRGNLTEKEMDAALLNKEILPPFLFDFLEEFESVEERLRYFSKLFVLFFQEMEKKKDPFLRFYFHFERGLRLSLVGFRAKKLGIDLDRELQYEDFSDPLVIEILSQKDSAQFEFPTEYEELGEKIGTVGIDPMELYEKVAQFRFEQVRERMQDYPFSLGYVLSYFVLFLLLEDKEALNEREGSALLNKLVKD